MGVVDADVFEPLTVLLVEGYERILGDLALVDDHTFALLVDLHSREHLSFLRVCTESMGLLLEGVHHVGLLNQRVRPVRTLLTCSVHASVGLSRLLVGVKALAAHCL